MNLLVFPFHDMRKNQKEGFRNRDSHFIEQLSTHPGVKMVLVINRPITPLEMVYKRSGWKTEGRVLKSNFRYRIVQLSEKLFVLDYLSFDIVNNLLQKKSWFWKAHREEGFISSIREAINYLNIKKYNVTMHGLYSSSAIEFLTYDSLVFDADDNWLRFPAYKPMYDKIYNAYKTYATKAERWITNSEENRTFFTKEFNIKDCTVIENGVDVEKFQINYPVPDDIRTLQRPVIGFGGSISHLIDTELLNYTAGKHPDKTFVLIGPVFDKKVFESIVKAPNMHYLGDKHYNNYKGYITNFDICIIPYYTGNKTHGGNAIKFFEYLAAGKKVISTNGNGVFKANSNVFLASDKEEFSEFIDSALLQEPELYNVPVEFTWRYKAEILIDKLLK